MLASWLRWAAVFGARRPWLSIGIAAALAVVSALLLPRLHISTSRTHLVSDANPEQRRLVAFNARFGYPDAPILVFTGGTPEARREAVDAVARRLERIPEIEGRVLSRVGPDLVAERLLLEDPVEARAALDAIGSDVGAIIEGGVPRWVDVLAARVEAGLEGGARAPHPDETKAGLVAMTALVRALDARLAGESADASLASLGAGRRIEGVDERGYLIGSGDQHVVVAFPTLDSDEGDAVAPLVRRIRAARDEALADLPSSGVDVAVTGLPALVTDELAAVERDLKVTSALSTFGIAVSLYFAFRSIRQAAVSFLPIGFGTLVTMGAAALAFGRLNLITASFTSVLLGLGDFGVHIQARLAEFMRGGVERKVAIEDALVKAGPGLLVGTLVTAAAFLTTTVTEFTAFAQLGLLTCLGLLVMLVATYLVIAPMMILVLGKRPKIAPEIPGMRATGSFVRRFPKAIVAVSVALTVGFGAFVRGVDFNGRYFELLPSNAESSRGLVAIEKDRLLSPITASVAVESIEEARSLAERLRAVDAVGWVESPADFLPVTDPARLEALRDVSAKLGRVDVDRLDRAAPTSEALLAATQRLVDALDEVTFALRQAHADTADVVALKDALRALDRTVRSLDAADVAARLASIDADVARLLRLAAARAAAVAERGGYDPEDVPAAWRAHFVSKDGAAVALHVHPRYDVWDPARSEAFVRDVRAVAPEATGVATTLAAHPKMIVEGFVQASALAAALVVAVLFVSFRNGRDMVVAAVPLVMGAVWMLGSMRPLGVQFNHANMIVLPLLLGLGVDAGVHLMIRYRQSAAERGGIADLDEILCSTGGGVLVASLTTIFGFAVMMLATYRGMVSLGLLMTIGMTATLALTLLVIPAILVLLGRAR